MLEKTDDSPAVPVRDEAGDLRRWTVIGSMVGFLVVGGLFGVSTFLFGGDAPAAVGVGLMTGLLGGPGFGGMMGFVLQHSKNEQRRSVDGRTTA